MRAGVFVNIASAGSGAIIFISLIAVANLIHELNRFYYDILDDVNDFKVKIYSTICSKWNNSVRK